MVRIEHQAARDLVEGLNSAEGLMNHDEAYKIIRRVNEEYRGETYSIPMEDYEFYLQAATSYIITAERLASIKSPGSLEQDKMYQLAKRIVEESPIKAKDAA